jgi:hypothetical protein
MVAVTCFGITLPSSGNVPSAFWEMLNWVVDRILWMGVLCLVTWCVAIWSRCTNSLTFNNCTFCPHCIYVFCIYLRTNSNLCHFNWLGFITELKSVYSAVRTGPLNKAVCASCLKGSFITVVGTRWKLHKLFVGLGREYKKQNPEYRDRKKSPY